MLRDDGPLRIAVLSSILIPIIQVTVHVAAGSGLFGGNPTGPETGVGVAFNLPDMVSYASWAYQAKLGLVTFSDLFTTEPHADVFFNLYFLVIGLVSRITGIEPLPLMEASSFALGPMAAFTVLAITRWLRFNPASQALGIVFALFGSGLSGLLILLFGVRPGADATYHDLFPLSELVFYPFHASVLVLLALTVLAAVRFFSPEEERPTTKHATLLGMVLLAVGLVRPYEAVTLTVVFNLTALVYLLSKPRWPWRRALLAFCVVDLLAVPPIAYAAFLSTLPVWGGFANQSMGFGEEGIDYFLRGFGLLWALAGLGVVFALKDKNRGLCFVGIWAVVAALMLCVSPSYGTKLVGGSVLADGLLAAYGLGRLLRECATLARRRATIRLIAGTIAVMALTPIVVFADIAKAGAPLIENDLLAAGKRIRELEGRRIPIVLTDLSAGAVLPGLFGERVYAGHWTLTPGLRQKARALRSSGIDGSGESTYDRALLGELRRTTKADYLLLRRTVPAAEAISRCSRVKPFWESERWIAVRLADWSCP